MVFIKHNLNYEETNTYNLLAGKLPHPDKPEILITDFILDAA